MRYGNASPELHCLCCWPRLIDASSSAALASFGFLKHHLRQACTIGKTMAVYWPPASAAILAAVATKSLH